jgi:hypothetical protein
VDFAERAWQPWVGRRRHPVALLRAVDFAERAWQPWVGGGQQAIAPRMWPDRLTGRMSSISQRHTTSARGKRDTLS